MATYRSLHVKYWSESDIESLSWNAKALMVYLLTNNHRNESALYSLTVTKMLVETSLTPDALASALAELAVAGKVYFDPGPGVVWVVNAVRYVTLNPNCVKSIANDVRNCPSVPLAVAFCDRYADVAQLSPSIVGIKKEIAQRRKPLANPLQGVPEGLPNPSIGLGIGLGLGIEDAREENEAGSPHEPEPPFTVDELLICAQRPGVDAPDEYTTWWYRSFAATGFTDGEGRVVKGWPRYFIAAWKRAQHTDWRAVIAKESRDAAARKHREHNRTAAPVDKRTPAEVKSDELFAARYKRLNPPSEMRADA